MTQATIRNSKYLKQWVFLLIAMVVAGEVSAQSVTNLSLIHI